MNLKKVPIHQIRITENKVSKWYGERSQRTFARLGYKNFNVFEAITPDNYKDRIKEDKLQLADWFSETEKAVWHSHYELWKKCVDSKAPMIIIEHDCMLEEKLPIIPDDMDLFCFTTAKKDERLLLPCCGYYINNNFARKLVEFVNEKTFDTSANNVDGWLMCRFYNIAKNDFDPKPVRPTSFYMNSRLGKLDPLPAVQFIDPARGTTIEHPKVR